MRFAVILMPLKGLYVSFVVYPRAVKESLDYGWFLIEVRKCNLCQLGPYTLVGKE